MMLPGEVWSLGLPEDDKPWHYLVTEADDDGVDLVLLDSFGDEECEPGDQIALSWDDVRYDDGQPGRLLWRRVA